MLEILFSNIFPPVFPDSIIVRRGKCDGISKTVGQDGFEKLSMIMSEDIDGDIGETTYNITTFLY